MKKIVTLAAMLALACVFCTAAFAQDVTIRTTVPERPAVTATPDDEHPDIADAIQNGTWGKPTATPAPVEQPAPAGNSASQGGCTQNAAASAPDPTEEPEGIPGQDDQGDDLAGDAGQEGGGTTTASDGETEEPAAGDPALIGASGNSLPVVGIAIGGGVFVLVLLLILLVRRRKK